MQRVKCKDRYSALRHNLSLHLTQCVIYRDTMCHMARFLLESKFRAKTPPRGVFGVLARVLQYLPPSFYIFPKLKTKNHSVSVALVTLCLRHRGLPYATRIMRAK